MPFLNEVLARFGLHVVSKQQLAEGEWLLLIARSEEAALPASPAQSYVLFAETSENPEISFDEAAAIQRRFTVPGEE